MHPNKIAIERASDLARSGVCSRIGEIIARLEREGYEGRHIEGRVLRGQLCNSIEEAKAGTTARDSFAKRGKRSEPIFVCTCANEQGTIDSEAREALLKAIARSH